MRQLGAPMASPQRSDRRNHIRWFAVDGSSDLAATSYFGVTNSGRSNFSHSAIFFRLFDA
jgi:hypothetical protein